MRMTCINASMNGVNYSILFVLDVTSCETYVNSNMNTFTTLFTKVLGYQIPKKLFDLDLSHWSIHLL